MIKKFSAIRSLVVMSAVGVLMAIGLASAGFTSSADAATYTASGVCGSNFTHLWAKEQLHNGSNYGPAYLYVYSNGSTKYCAVSIATGKAYGVSKPMSVVAKTVAYTNGPNEVVNKSSDSANYAYYAGPAKTTTNYNVYNGKLGVKFTGDMTYKGVAYSAVASSF